MPEKKFVRYAMFGSLYFTQGTILSYFTALNALYFLSRGLSMTSVGHLRLDRDDPLRDKDLPWDALRQGQPCFGMGAP